MSIILYGAYGYTGELIAHHAAKLNVRLTLAGRDRAKLEPLAQAVSMPFAVCDLNDASRLDALLLHHDVVLHCAGPFRYTSKPMVDACLRTRTQYVDITGEIDVFEAVQRRDQEAKAKGIVMLPGAGFDVVPTDCLAAWLHQHMPDAVRLDLALKTYGGISHGTATTAVEVSGDGGMVRIDGKLHRELVAHRDVEADFGDGTEIAVSIPWGDVSTAWASTGIPNITTYLRLPTVARKRLRYLARLHPVMRLPALKKLVLWWIKNQPRGPSEDVRRTGAVAIWGRVQNGSGEVISARLQGPEGYKLTAETALEIATAIDSGQEVHGFQTPSSLFGPDFILKFEGVTRKLLPSTRANA